MRQVRGTAFSNNTLSISLSPSPPLILGTYKFQKSDMRREGFDPSLVSDRLYFLDPSRGRYAALDQELHRSILSGKQKL